MVMKKNLPEINTFRLFLMGISLFCCLIYVILIASADSLTRIFQAAGIHDIHQYYYWDDKLHGVCLDKLVEDLERAPPQSVVVLSASGHYPTGADLSENQWEIIMQIIKVNLLNQRTNSSLMLFKSRFVLNFQQRRGLFPFFLLPVHGLNTGDLGRDARPIQKCAALGMELICAQSFSHCFGQYGRKSSQSTVAP